MKENILKIGEEFEGLRVERKLSQHHDGEREVYLVTDPEGQKLVLTLYDMDSDLARDQAINRTDVDGNIKETYISEIMSLKEFNVAPGICAVIQTGDTDLNGRRLIWMLQPYFDGVSLEEELRNGRVYGVNDIGRLGSFLCVVAERAAKITSGGGHYNISPANILLAYENGALKDAVVTGFTYVTGTEGGSGIKGYDEADWRNRAPETYKGVFNTKCDIYGIGMTLLEMANVAAAGPQSHFVSSEEMPDKDADKLKKTALLYRRDLWSQTEKTLPGSLRTILRKATDPSSIGRFPTPGRFKDFIESYITKETLGITPAESDAASDGDSSPEGRANPKERKLKIGPQKAAVSENSRIKESTDAHALDKVAGMEEVKNFFRRDFISIVRNPKIAARYGIKPSNCTLLYGPQGCGKTFIAEKAAQESGLKYRIVTPSELGSVYIHGSQQKIAETFAEAEKKGPMILIFDEFDALVPSRNMESNPHQANEVNEMLVQLNNCAERGIYVIACTNRPAELDPAIMRKGRVDRTVYVPLPDLEVRKELFRLELEQRPCDPDIDFEDLGKATDHFSCSDITYIVDEAARQCFDETLRNGLQEPIPLSMKRLKEVASTVVPSVSEMQRRDYLALRDRMEDRRGRDARRSIGFAK